MSRSWTFHCMDASRLGNANKYLGPIKSCLVFKAMLNSPFAAIETAALVRVFHQMAKYLPRMTCFARARMNSGLLQINLYIGRACQLNNNTSSDMIAWRALGNQVTMQSGIQVSTTMHSVAAYPFDPQRIIRGISYLIEPTILPAAMLQHDIAFYIPDQYIDLLRTHPCNSSGTALDLNTPALYAIRLLCYQTADPRRKVVWPACILSVFMSGMSEPLMIPRKRGLFVPGESTSAPPRVMEYGDDYAVNLTGSVRSGMNVLTILVNGHVDISKYFIAVDIVAFLTRAQMDAEMQESMWKLPFNHSIKQLNDTLDKFTKDDDIITEESIEIPLTCPISGRRMRYPCRTLRCVHTKVFDYESWRDLPKHIQDICPICDISFRAEDVVFDIYFKALCQVLPSNVDRAILRRDGEFSVKNLSEGSEQLLAAEFRALADQLISLQRLKIHS
ncbi:hypothetical protein BDR26DRAFT_862180 [Obelidium mucronatum]|nr:hypothetical protein BDR26DRAFT_862180 [Obelidium mucronatum]